MVGFLIHLSPYFQNCFRFPICRYRNRICKILTIRDPLIVKNLKIFPNVVFDSSNYAFWDTERNAKKPQPSTQHRSLKNLEKLPKNSQKCISVKNSQFLTVFLDFSKLRSKFCKHGFYTYKLENESSFENRAMNELRIQPGMIQNL